MPLHPLLLAPEFAHLPFEVTADPGMFGPTLWYVTEATA